MASAETTSTHNHSTRRILLIDAVVWAETYPLIHPLRDVRHWFARWLGDFKNVELVYANAESELSGFLNQSDHALNGVIMSGSPRDAWADDPINEKLCQFVRALHEREIPFLGVCFGHQILARAFGAKVGRHPGGLELGNTPVRLTPEGERSPLFNGFPKQFEVFSSHADSVLEAPARATTLVEGGFTPVQGIQIGARSFGVQFHPETDPETLRFLWSVRRDLWRPRVSFDLDHVLDHLAPIPMSGHVLRNFVQNIAL